MVTLMKALVFDGHLRLDANHPLPAPRPGWTRIRVIRAGICRTDQEITRGYMNFRGVPGHEFVGIVDQSDEASLLGRRVVGDINAACGDCDWCRRGLGHHCPNRSTLGIFNLDGCFAEYCTLPSSNLYAVPDDISDDAAVFVEPLSAAFRILDQLPISSTDRCMVLGDGKLGILCAWALSTVSRHVTLVGHHPGKLKMARWNGVRTTAKTGAEDGGADVVVEATGTSAGLMESIALCRPRGTVVLKSTIAAEGGMNLAPVVIHEINILGSRCGDFRRGLAEIARHRFPLEGLITHRFPLDRAVEAFAAATQPAALKVLIDMPAV